jgi:hypothetical protein
MHTNAVTLLDYMESDEAHVRAAHKVPGAFFYPQFEVFPPAPCPGAMCAGWGQNRKGR